MALPLPTPRTIRLVWAMRLVEMGKAPSVQDVIDAKHTWCFRCGWQYEVPATERAHIHARSEGGSDYADNLHLLCRPCHVQSELLYGDAYGEWFMTRGWRHDLDRAGLL